MNKVSKIAGMAIAASAAALFLSGCETTAGQSPDRKSVV